MKVAITGGTGFVGNHLAERLVAEGHSVVLISRHVGKAPLSERAIHVAGDLSNVSVLIAAFQGCEAVAHCAGINRELGA
jgi:nucleoside-diphosphate-sugar epimerase